MFDFFKAAFVPRRLFAIFIAALVLAAPHLGPVRDALHAHVPGLVASGFDVVLSQIGAGSAMAMSFISANTEQLLVQYLEDTYPITMIQGRPFFDRITKKSNVGGESVKVPLNISYGGGMGGTFANALANAQPSGAKRIAFTVDPAKEYGITTLDNDEVPFTKTPESAIDITTDATRGAMENAAQNFEAMVFGSGYGDLATILVATNTSGNIWVLTFTNPSDALRFNIGNVLNSKATPAAASLDTGSATVTGTNPIQGSIQVDVASTGMTPTAGHVLGIEGQIAASTSIVTFPGIFGWCPPITARTNGVVGDTFLGVTRSAATSVVASSGWALDGRKKALAPSINGLCAQMANLKNSKPTLGICNPVTLGRFAAELDTKIRYDMPSKDIAEAMFEGIEIMTPAGKIEMFAEPACPANQIVITKASDWIFAYPDRPFAPSRLDGKIMTQDYDTNVTRFAITCAGFFYTTNPASTGVITISA